MNAPSIKNLGQGTASVARLIEPLKSTGSGSNIGNRANIGLGRSGIAHQGFTAQDTARELLEEVT